MVKKQILMLVFWGCAATGFETLHATTLWLHNKSDTPVAWDISWTGACHGPTWDVIQPNTSRDSHEDWCSLSKTTFRFLNKDGTIIRQTERYSEPGNATFLAYKDATDGQYKIYVKSAWHDITDFVSDLPGKIKDLGEAGVRGITTGLSYVGEGLNIALDKTGVKYLYDKLKIQDAVSWFKEQADTVYGKAIKPAFMIVKPGVDFATEGAKAAAKFTLNIAGSVPDALELVTNDGHCPHAEIECFAGTGENTLSCGKIEANRGFNALQGGCQIKPGEIQNACKIRCQDMHQTTFKPEDISFTVLDKTGFRVADFVNLFKKKDCSSVGVKCYAGFGEGRALCGEAQIGTAASSLGKGCTLNLGEIKSKCDDVCMDALGTTSND